jgi:hypothetical protein
MAGFLVLALFFGGIAAFVVGITLWAGKLSARAHANFVQLAGRLGLSPKPVTPKWGRFWPAGEAEGAFRGNPARLFSFTTGSGKHRITWAALALRPPATGGLTFSIARQDLGAKIAELFGAREITVGDPAFDKAWFIQTNQPDFLAAALIPELRARISALFANSANVRQPSFKLEDSGAVVYREAGDFSNTSRVERFIRAADVTSDLAALAEVFAQQAPSQH